jgi:predicted membrane channel-forming protein YqfA (hemolysin III family)
LPISASDTQWWSIARFGIFLLSPVTCFVFSQKYQA